jgi:hypothetical protein
MSATISTYGAIPLPAGTVIPSGIGPFASSVFGFEQLATAPLQFANLGILQIDAYTRGIGFPSGAAGSFPFPFPFPVGTI